MTIENLVKKFLEEEKFTLRNALAYSGLGLAEATGKISEIIKRVAFDGHPYNDERKESVADALGLLKFVYIILCGSTGFSEDECNQRFVNWWLIQEKQLEEVEQLNEIRPSVLELGKHVKSLDKLQNVKTHERQHNKV